MTFRNALEDIGRLMRASREIDERADPMPNQTVLADEIRRGEPRLGFGTSAKDLRRRSPRRKPGARRAPLIARPDHREGLPTSRLRGRGGRHVNRDRGERRTPSGGAVSDQSRCSSSLLNVRRSTRSRSIAAPRTTPSRSASATAPRRPSGLNRYSRRCGPASGRSVPAGRMNPRSCMR